MQSERTILFVCRFNSARSQLGEALARSLAPPAVRVLSAGLQQTVVNDEVRRAMAEIGLDASGQRSKHLDELSNEAVDDVFVLAEEAWEESVRRFPQARHHRWSMQDPIALDSAQSVAAAVRAARDELGVRLGREFGGLGPCF